MKNLPASRAKLDKKYKIMTKKVLMKILIGIDMTKLERESADG